MNHTNFYAITTQVSYCATSVQKTGATEAIVDERAIFKHENLHAALRIRTLFRLNLRANPRFCKFEKETMEAYWVNDARENERLMVPSWHS